MTAVLAAEPTVYLVRDKGWGARVKITIASTPEADKAAAAFLARVTHYEFGQDNYHVTEPGEDNNPYGDAMTELLYPTCEHGMSAQLCMGPMHFMSYEQERAMGW